MQKILKKKVETSRLCNSYALAANDSMKTMQEWQVVDEELDRALDDIDSEQYTSSVFKK